MMTTNLFVIVNQKQLRTEENFRILLPFFRTSWGVGFLNSAILNIFHNRVEFGTILEGLRNFGGGGCWTPQPLPSPPSVRHWKNMSQPQFVHTNPGRFWILLPFFRTYRGVWVLNSAILTIFTVGLSLARFWTAFRISGGGVEHPNRPLGTPLEKRVPAPLYPKQISHGLSWNRKLFLILKNYFRSWVRPIYVAGNLSGRWKCKMKLDSSYAPRKRLSTLLVWRVKGEKLMSVLGTTALRKQPCCVSPMQTFILTPSVTRIHLSRLPQSF